MWLIEMYHLHLNKMNQKAILPPPAEEARAAQVPRTQKSHVPEPNAPGCSLEFFFWPFFLQ